MHRCTEQTWLMVFTASAATYLQDTARSRCDSAASRLCGTGGVAQAARSDVQKKLRRVTGRAAQQQQQQHLATAMLCCAVPTFSVHSAL